MKVRCALWMSLLMLAGTSAIQAQATLSIPDFQISQGETKTVSLDMENTVAVRAFQVQIVLPENLKLASAPTVAPARQGSVLDEFGEETEVETTVTIQARDDGALAHQGR